MQLLLRARDSFVNLIFPPRCVGCDAPCPAAFCVTCAISVDRIGAACTRCGLPLPESQGPCLGCLQRPPPWATAHSVFLFGGALAEAIRRCKYADRPELARPLGRLLGPAVQLVDVVAPVPLHPRRLRARGFNQAALLALAAGGPVDVRALVRVRDTSPQAGLTAAERRRNLAGAFEARAERVRDRRVLVIDDVLTTGATLEAVTRALTDAGAAEVHVLTLARAVP
jgi:ComF family protein